MGLATFLDASFDKSKANNVEISADDPFNCLLPSFTRSDIDHWKRKAEEMVFYIKMCRQRKLLFLMSLREQLN